MATKEATIVLMVERDLKEFLQNVAGSKRITLSEYTRHVLNVGLDEIHQGQLESP